MTTPLTPLDDRCDAVSDDGYECILTIGHTLPHMRRPCDATCDNCDCDFWYSYQDDDFEKVVEP